MKKILLSFILCFLISNINIYAQEYHFGPDCLGIWCSIDVDLTTSPTPKYHEYPFPDPPEEIGVANTIRGEVVIVHQSRVNCIGPGRPYINNELGGNLILCLDLLDLDLTGEETEALVSFPVQKLSIYGDQCYYYIRIVIKR